MTLRADTLAVLRDWRPATDPAAQEQLRTEYLAFVTGNDDATWRSCRPGHVTASTLVLSAAYDRVLLTLHPKVGRWLQLGGHCEPGDTSLAAAALREAQEESGIAGLRLAPGPARLDRHRVGCHGGSWHYDVQYVATAPAGAVARISAESLDLAWFELDALPEPADPALVALVAAARSTLAY